MAQMNELERDEEKLALAEISGTPKHIEINERTIKAYQEEFAKKGLVIEQHKDYPTGETGFKMVKRVKKFDSMVDPKSIRKIISTMVSQPVSVTGKDGKRVTKDALYYTGYYQGTNSREVPLPIASFAEGYYFKPKLVFSFVDQHILSILLLVKEEASIKLQGNELQNITYSYPNQRRKGANSWKI